MTQAELTVLHCSEDGAVTATAYRFCASWEALEPTGRHAQVPGRLKPQTARQSAPKARRNAFAPLA